MYNLVRKITRLIFVVNILKLKLYFTLEKINIKLLTHLKINNYFYLFIVTYN